jgi:hypothetical protein
MKELLNEKTATVVTIENEAVLNDPKARGLISFVTQCIANSIKYLTYEMKIHVCEDNQNLIHNVSIVKGDGLGSSDHESFSVTYKLQYGYFIISETNFVDFELLEKRLNEYL